MCIFVLLNEYLHSINLIYFHFSYLIMSSVLGIPVEYKYTSDMFG